MTYATINLLHRLLEGYVDYLEDELQDAERALEEAIAVNEDAAKEGDKEAFEAISDAEKNKQSVSADLNEAVVAMKAFEKHEWT